MITSITFKQSVSKPVPTNYVFVADVSGSMYSELPKIRKHLKDNLGMLVKPNDTVSILYFASKGQFGSVFVGQPIRDITDLTEIHSAIDRYLKPTGCTGFVEPLQLACKVGKELAQNGNLNSLIFMTDGYDNCWSTNQILAACQELPTVFSDISFMEYGWYCNRELLQQMTQAVNGLHTFSETFADYEKSFESILTATTSKRIEVEVGDATNVIFIDDGKVQVINAVKGVALIPEHISEVWAVNDETINTISDTSDEQELYVALYFGIHTMNPDLAWKALKLLGDVRLIKAYDNCFTKQDYSNVKQLVSGAVVDKSERFTMGINHDMVPDDNAYTVIDVLESLVGIDAMLDTNSEDFLYNRTGRKSVQKDDDTIDLLSEQIANAETTEERKALAAKLVSHEEWTPRFVANDEPISMNKLVTNGNRPNISISTSLSGSIELPESKQSEFGLPETIDTFITRNYTIVKDGIINMKLLPVIINKTDLATIHGYVDYYVTQETDTHYHLTIVLTSVPLVNRSMTRSISGEVFARNQVKLLGLKAKQKVLKFYRDLHVGKVNAQGYAKLYGDNAANWLSEQGIRDYGFSPKTTREESTDVYMSKELNVKIKGASSLPAVQATIDKRTSGKKLNAADLLMLAAIDEYNSDVELMNDEEIKEYLKTKTKFVINANRSLESKLAKVMYGIVVGKAWFADIDFEDPTITVTESGNQFDVTLVLEEKEVKI